jgi:hypothetical protein
MKKIITLFFLLAMFTQTISAATVSGEKLKASEIMIPVGNTGKSISMLDLSTMSVNDFEQLSGKKLKGFDKMMFKSGQKELRHCINADGTLNNKRLEKLYKKDHKDLTAGFNIGGFALGFLLSLIGVLLAYIIKTDNPSNFRKWAWIGFGVSLAIIILIAIF